MSNYKASLYLETMNYLAHIYLSGDNDLLTIGNFMADSIKGKKYQKYPKSVQDGILLHRAIDYYTDTHPVVLQSIRRLFPIYSHYSSIIVDIFYDHFLAHNWENFSATPLKKYTEDFYQLLMGNINLLPAQVKRFLPYMIQDNWLLSYAEIKGIEKVLSGMDIRTGQKSGMYKAGNELRQYYAEFQQDFENFFEELQRFSKDKIMEITTN